LRRAWFEYLTDYDGATEDVTDADTLTRTRARLVDEIEGLCEDRGVPLQRVAVVGYSQGGNVAVDLACHLRVGLCVTLASHKLSVTDRPIHCRWNALMLSRDECFPMDTFAPLVAEASTVDVLDDYHGMDACGEEAIAFLEGVLDAFAPAMPDGILEIEERPEEQKRHTDVSCPAPASL
jgi:pimeloyl-ACP methyl ester carboxylesterase